MQNLDVKFNHLGISDVADDSGSPVLEHLYQEGYILCHYEDVVSFDPTEYGDDTGDLESLVDSIRDDSTYLCYVRLSRDNGSDGTRQLGLLKPETEPRIIAARKTSDSIAGGRVDGYEIREYPESDITTAKQELDSEDWRIYKGAQIDDVKQLSPEEHAWLNEVPGTTWSNWNPANQIYDLYAGNNLNPRDPRSYSPTQVELLCGEFLRIVRSSYCPVMDPGGPSDTADLDLIGYDAGTRVIGEVKQIRGSPSADDLKVLGAQSQKADTDAYLFTLTSPQEDYSEITEVSLNTVVETLYEIERTRRTMDQMVSYGSNGVEEQSES